MSMDGLTRDNSHLSRVTHGSSRALLEISEATTEDAGSAISCTDTLPEDVSALVAASLSAASRRAYRSDLAHFEAWGGQLPASPEVVASYLAAHARTLSPATLSRRIATFSKAHEARGLPNPCKAEIVRAVLRGIRRTVGTAQRQAKPLLRDDLFQVLDQLGDSLRDQRDRALLLFGFAGGFRRSELVRLNVEDVETTRQGLIVVLRGSKTDQEHAGRRVGIPHGRGRHCPVEAVQTWLSAAGIVSGPLFRPVTRHGHIRPEALTGDAVSVLLRKRLAAAGLDPKCYSGHSLRAGLATSAAQHGVSTTKIRQQTGHASDAMLNRYIREGELFLGNAAGVLL